MRKTPGQVREPQTGAPLPPLPLAPPAPSAAPHFSQPSQLRASGSSMHPSTPHNLLELLPPSPPPLPRPLLGSRLVPGGEVANTLNLKVLKFLSPPWPPSRPSFPLEPLFLSALSALCLLLVQLSVGIEQAPPPHIPHVQCTSTGTCSASCTSGVDSLA